jgi:hypothetical protein
MVARESKNVSIVEKFGYHKRAEQLILRRTLGGPPGECNRQCCHGERTKAAIAEQQKFSALLKMLRAGLT